MSIECNPQVYAAKNIDFKTRMSSRSGGVFTAIADYVFSLDGVVYGCVLTDDFEVVHRRAETKEERNCMRGSKYVQSNLGRIFEDVKKDLLNEKTVLFSGTACQIAGLRSFLNKDYDNLICIDIVCYGVPSPMVWRDYLEWWENKLGGKCTSVDFRDKRRFGWSNHFETLTFKTKLRKKKTIHSAVYRNLFSGREVLRPSCYQCPYKSIKRWGDISLADFWGIDKAVPKFNDNNGVSLVIVNNKKGEDIFNRICGCLQVLETEVEACLQPALRYPFSCPDTRVKFWEDYNTLPFGKIAECYGGYSKGERISIYKTYVKSILKKFLMKFRY